VTGGAVRYLPDKGKKKVFYLRMTSMRRQEIPSLRYWSPPNIPMLAKCRILGVGSLPKCSYTPDLGDVHMTEEAFECPNEHENITWMGSV
jgi:hypothetical protein